MERIIVCCTLWATIVVMVMARPRLERSIVDAVDVRRLATDYYKNFVRQPSNRCSTPQPRIVSVGRTHPDPGRSYVTSCVLLHRCEHDTGCCAAPNEVCAPIPDAIETVYLPVLYSGGGRMSGAEMMPFKNHTACHCVDRKVLAAAA